MSKGDSMFHRRAVDYSAFWDFKPGQRVRTSDGHFGIVASVTDVPGGAEAYSVVLDNNAGGGDYNSSQLTATQDAATASTMNLAALDYPELAEVINQHPDISVPHIARKTAAVDVDAINPQHHKKPLNVTPLPAHNVPYGGWGNAGWGMGGWGGYAYPDGITPGDDHDNGGTTTDGDISGIDAGGLSGGGMDSTGSLIVTAASDPDFRFHVTSSWKDVRNKATAIRRDGKVRIISSHSGIVVAQVRGDHNVYQTEIHLGASKGVNWWECGCPWSKVSWGRTRQWKRFEGRQCSHALATLYEAQSKGMFGREINEQQKLPKWLNKHTRIVTETNPFENTQEGYGVTAAMENESNMSPIGAWLIESMIAGSELDECLFALSTAGIDPEEFPIARALVIALDQPEIWNHFRPGATEQITSPFEDPANSGPGRGDPENWANVHMDANPHHNVFESYASVRKESFIGALMTLIRTLGPAALKQLAPKLINHEINKHVNPAQGPAAAPSPAQSPVQAPVDKNPGQVLAPGKIPAFASKTANLFTKTALKDFSQAEKEELQNEGIGSLARNLSSLSLEGTHYEHMPLIVTKVDDDNFWL